MKNWSTYIFLLVAGTLSLLATSCSQEDEGLESVLVSNGKATVQFSIALGNSGAGSRATDNSTWGDSYTPDDSNIGNEFENTINLKQFHVSLTLADGTSVPIKSISTPIQKALNVYDFVADVLVEGTPSLKDAKIEVYANYGDNLTTFETSYTDDLVGQGVPNIPMWGVHTITEDFTLAGGNTIDLRTTPIDLLRSMAKIEVIINPALTDFTIESVGLNKYNKKGNLKPIHKDENGNVVGLPKTKDYNREECINAFSSLQSYGDFTGLPFTYDATSKSYVLYVPEYDNPKQEDADDAVIFLYIKKGDTYISTQLGSNGAIKMTDLNLVRNHWYKYYIKSINEDIEFELKYQVINWIEIDNGELIFGNGSGNVNTIE